MTWREFFSELGWTVLAVVVMAVPFVLIMIAARTQGT